MSALVSNSALSVDIFAISPSLPLLPIVDQMAHVMDKSDPASEMDADDMSEGDVTAAAASGGGLRRLFDIVMAGLVGSTPHMQSATVMVWGEWQPGVTS